MAREFPLWIVVLLPWLGALAVLLVARAGVGLLGRERARALAHYLGLGASTLAVLFTVQIIDHLLAPEDPRALAHTPLRELIGPVAIGELHTGLTLVADRLSASAAVLIAGLSVLTRMFVPGPAGQRALGLGDPSGDPVRALRRLATLGVVEGAALLVVLAGDLALAAFGWVLLGIGTALLVAREVDDERRASAATRVLSLAVAGDLALGAGAIALLAAGIGLAHDGLWAPLTGDQLYAFVVEGVSFADLIGALLVAAVVLRLASLAWTGSSLAAAPIDAVLIPAPCVYLLLRYSRVLSYAPSLLAALVIAGIALVLLGAAFAWSRPRSPRAGSWSWGLEGVEQGLAGLGVVWLGLLLLVLGVGAWRTAALLLLARGLDRLSLRLLVVVADGRPLPRVSGSIGRVVLWAAAGVIPSLTLVALVSACVDVLARASVLAPGSAWLGGLAVVLGAAMCGAASARLAGELVAASDSATDSTTDDEDGLDFGPIALALAASIGLGILALAAVFSLAPSPLAWLDKTLPLAGGHAAAPTGLRTSMRDGLLVAAIWRVGSLVLVASAVVIGWIGARRGEGEGLRARLARALEALLGRAGRRVAGLSSLVLRGLAELAARGVGRGVFEEGPRIAASLVRDTGWVLRRFGADDRLELGGGRRALLGLGLGFALVLGWLFLKPNVSSLGPVDDYGFGGLKIELIKAGGHDDDDDDDDGHGADGQGAPTDAPSPIPSTLPPRDDGAERPAIGPDPQLRDRPRPGSEVPR